MTMTTETIETYLPMIEAFCKTSADLGDVLTSRVDRNPHTGLFLTGEPAETFGEDLPCLAVGKDELGNWSALFLHDGRVLTLQFLASEVC